MEPEASKVRSYISALDLPDAGPSLESAEAPPSLGTGRDAVAIGAQLTEFTPEVPRDLRERIADSMLLAQLAADKAAQSDTEPFAWYGKYVEVLQTVGWQIAELESLDTKLEESGADVHRAIIPVVAAALAPAAAAASIVLAALDGLAKMGKDSPWITLFDKASSHTRGAKFQVGQVDVDKHGNPHITLFCFAIDASRTITQVLFFKFKESRATVRQSVRGLTSTPAHLELAGRAVADRVKPFIVDYIKSIDL